MLLLLHHHSQQHKHSARWTAPLKLMTVQEYTGWCCAVQSPLRWRPRAGQLPGARRARKIWTVFPAQGGSWGTLAGSLSRWSAPTEACS